MPMMPGMPMPPGLPLGQSGGASPFGGGPPPGVPMGPMGPNIASPVQQAGPAIPPELGQGAMQLANFVSQNPGSAVITTGLIEAMTKLIKMMTTVGEPKQKQTRVNPFGPAVGDTDQIAQRQASMPPTLPNPMAILAQAGGGRPPGM